MTPGKGSRQPPAEFALPLHRCHGHIKYLRAHPLRKSQRFRKTHPLRCHPDVSLSIRKNDRQLPQRLGLRRSARHQFREVFIAQCLTHGSFPDRDCVARRPQGKPRSQPPKDQDRRGAKNPDIAVQFRKCLLD